MRVGLPEAGFTGKVIFKQRLEGSESQLPGCLVRMFLREGREDKETLKLRRAWPKKSKEIGASGTEEVRRGFTFNSHVKLTAWLRPVAFNSWFIYA